MDNAGFDIIAKTEAVDKVVRDFAQQLGLYISDMTAECEQLAKSLHRLGGEWEGSSYDAFANKIKDRIYAIRSAIAKAEEQKKYLDETSEKYRLMLDYMKKASE